MKSNTIILSLVLFFGTFANATASSVAQTRAAEFLLRQAQTLAQAQLSRQTGQACPPPQPQPTSDIDCTNFVAGSFPTQDQKIQAVAACYGNYGDSCVKHTAGSFPTFDQRIAAARACRYVTDTTCADYVAGSFPTVDQQITATEACGPASVDCVKNAAGSFPTFDQRVAAARACSGQ